MRLPERIGRYQVQALVGRGGFGFVVRAYDEALDDAVAIKVLAENWSADDDFRNRFVEEARLLRRIRSDDLVTVHDIGELDDGRPYFVMTFAERGTLAERLSGRHNLGLDPPSARKLVDTLAGGLGALHAAGIVHRDINPKNILVRPLDVPQQAEQRRMAATRVRTGLVATDERLLLGDLGLAKDFVRSGSASASVLGGTPDYFAPEQIDPNATIGPATDTYAATGVLWETVTASRPPGPHNLAAAAAGVDESWRPFFTQGLAKNPDDRFSNVAEWRSAALSLIGAAEAAAGAGSPGEGAAPRSVLSNPYKGLAAFQPEDQTRFFGRDELVATLVERLGLDRVLVVGGPSGSGKSSVVRAGLIPSVGAGAISGSGWWPVALFTPRSNPSAELSYQLTKLSQAATQLADAVPNTITRDSERARYLADRIGEASGGLLLVIDQFEELFTLSGSNEQQAFVDTLSALADPTASRVRIVIVVRADFYGTCAAFPWLAERITSNQVLVGPMTRAELRRAIEQPAIATAMRLEDGLVDAVLDDGGDEPGALPLVSHAMAETWRRRSGSMLTVDGYEQAGGVAGAISQTADALYKGSFNAQEREACRRLMLRLVAPGEGTSDARRRLPMTGLDFDTAPAVSKRVAEEMVEARLLTVDRESIEIAHEALLRTWPRLRRWIEESRDDLRMRQRISHAAAEWLGEDRDPDLLYRGTPLQSALEWMEGHEDVLGPEDREFLDASEQAFRLAEEEAVAQERGSRRIRRIAVSVLAVLTVVAVAASIVAWSASREARSVFNQSLATQAATLVDSDPRAAAALGVEAMARGETESIDARVALVQSSERLATADYAPAASPAVVGDALTVAASPDGTMVATGTRDGTIRLWDAKTEPLSPVVPGHDGGIQEMVFTLDGRSVVSGGDDGSVKLWDVSDPAAVPAPLLVGETDGIVWSVDLAPDGVTLASASEDGTIRLWDLEARRQLGEPLAEGALDFTTVSFGPDGRLLLVGNGRGEVTGWTLPERQVVIETFNAHQSDVWEIEFDPNGEVFATASSDGRIRIWETATTNMVGEPFAGTDAVDVRGVQMIGFGQVAAGDEVGRLWTANFDGTSRESADSPHRAQISDTAAAAGVLMTLGDDQQLQPWTEAGTPTAIHVAAFTEGAFAVAASQDGGRIAVGDGTGGISILDATSGETMHGPVAVHDGTVWSLAYDDESARLVSGGDDGAVFLLDGATGEVRSAVAQVDDGVSAVLLEGDLILVGTDAGDVTVWDADRLLHTLPGHFGGVTAMAMSPDGVLAVSDRSGSVSFWDVAAGTAAMPSMVVEDNTIWDVAWSLDGTMLATASADDVVLLWDAASQDLLFSLGKHSKGALGVTFLPDGVTLAATSGDGTVRLWDVGSGRPLGGALTGHTDGAWRLSAIPDEVRFVTTSRDGTVRVWDVLDVNRACQRAAGAFDMEHQRRSLGEGVSPAGCQDDM